MTAHWESVLTQISEKQCRYQDFMQPLVGTLYQLIEQARSTPVRQFRGLVAPGGAKKSFSKGKAKGKKRQRMPRRRHNNLPGGREEAIPHGRRFSARLVNGLH